MQDIKLRNNHLHTYYHILLFVGNCFNLFRSLRRCLFVIISPPTPMRCHLPRLRKLAFSDYLLANYNTEFEPNNYLSILFILRVCVQRYLEDSVLYTYYICLRSPLETAFVAVCNCFY